MDNSYLATEERIQADFSAARAHKKPYKSALACEFHVPPQPLLM